MKEVKSRHYKMDDTDIQMVSYPLYSYNREKLRDPFQLEIFKPPGGDHQIKCDPPKHVTQPLEQFPLDSLSIVGNIKHSDKERWVLVKTSDGTIHRLKTHDFMGKHNGQITKITASTIELRELIEQGNGDCVEQRTILTLKAP